MTLQEVPVTTDARQTFDVALAGQLVRFDIWWQPFDDNWYMSLAWQTGERIVSGRRIIVGQNVLEGVVTDFRGSLVVNALTPALNFDAWDISAQLLFDSEG